MSLKARITSLFMGSFIYLSFTVSAFGSCVLPANAIEAENCNPGTPPSIWDISGAGDPSIQGFATDISVNVGQTIYFKVNTDATAYSLDIYRMGYYGGSGARHIATVSPSAVLPQTQPPCLTDSVTQLVDCGNWSISASWSVPANATSGIYFALLGRSDTGGESHIVFIVRNDASHSAVLFQTADESWQAYNDFGGPSLYGSNYVFDLNSRASKVSYNRPFETRGFGVESATWVFGVEYPMVRWLEQNSYDVSYFTGIDAARYGSLILNHKAYVTAGHDEYWSGPHRVSVEAARDAGVNMAFFTGNEVFWKTRLEPSIDGTNTPNRTLVCYKETLAGRSIDPLDPPTWTGTWRDNRFSPPADGGRPENSLTGTLFMVNGPGADNNGTLAMKVPYSDGQMRFWRNTSIASLTPGQTANLPKGTLGYEWDEDVDNGSRPAGLIHLSTSSYSLTSDFLLDQGATYGAGSATHHLTLYRASSGALVFGAGTVQWAWGLDSNHDNPFFFPNTAANVPMQQATVNLLADMGAQPATLKSGLVLASASSDTVAPTSSITWPTNGTSIAGGSTVNVTGVAIDSGGGVVGGVEVSVDGGQTWHPASGRENWSYSWNPPALGSFTLRSRAADDSGNIEVASSTASVITVNPPDCPCTALSGQPSQIDSEDPTPVEVGVRFRSDFDGYVTGIRFYKASGNGGTHVGNLWTNTGTLLATATFTNESASGWQRVSFNQPVAISANMTYVASYFAPSGHYSVNPRFFSGVGSDAPPLHLLADGVDGSNGLYIYSSTSRFPTQTFNSSSYWVDVSYIPSSSMPGALPALLTVPSNLSFVAYTGQPNPGPQTITVYNEGGGTLDWTASSNSSWLLVSPSGSTPGSLIVSIDDSNLVAGVYNGVITVSSSGANNPPQTISVSLTLTSLLLASNFSDGTMRGWAFSPLGLASNWSVSNSVLQYNGGGHTQVYAGNSDWTNYTLSADIKLATLNDYPGGIRGRIDANTGAGYAVWLYPQEGLIKLFRNSAWNIDSGAVLLGQGNAIFDATAFHTVQLSFQGSQIRVLYDGKLAVGANDATYVAGAIALDVSNQVIYFANVNVTSPAANTGSIALGTGSISVSTNYHAANPSPQTVALNGVGGTLVWTASADQPWLSVTPTWGTTNATLQVSIASSTLEPGAYSGTITLVALGAVNTIQTIAVSLNVVAPPSTLAVSTTSLDFIAVVGQSAAGQNLIVSNGGGYGSFNWTATSDSPWLAASPSSGITPQNVNVSVNSSSLSPGNYTGNLNMTASGVSNSLQTIPVSLQVLLQEMNENFADQGLGWTISPMGHAEAWTAANGVYSYSGAGLSQSCSGTSGWSDYVFETNLQLSNLSNWPGGIRGRVNPATGSGYAVWLYPGSAKAILYRIPQWDINAAGIVELAEAPLNFDTGVHDLRLDFRGSTISVSWDGRRLIVATDAAYTSGLVCLDTDSQPISYSNLRVAAVENQVSLDPISPSNLSFVASPGSASAAQTVPVTAGGASTAWGVKANVPWLVVNASSSLTPSSLSIRADASTLGAGTYNGTITLSAPGASNSPITIQVSFAVKSALLSASPSALTFFGASTLNPVSQTISVTNPGTGTLNFTASSTSPWLVLSSPAGAAPATISVSPNAAVAGVGTFSDTITLSSGDAPNSPVTVAVSLQIGSLLFNDDFSSGDGNWLASPLGNADGWSVVNGSYVYSGNGHTQSFTGSSAWTDYTVATDFQLSSLNDYPGGLRGRVNTITGASYGVWIYPAERVLKLFRIGQWSIDADLSLLGQSGQLVMDTNWHNLRLTFHGSTVQVYYDNVLTITAADNSYSQGVVALDVSNQPIKFDNVTVISLP